MIGIMETVSRVTQKYLPEGHLWNEQRIGPELRHSLCEYIATCEQCGQQLYVTKFVGEEPEVVGIEDLEACK